MQDFSFYIVTDTHLFDNRLGASGPAYEARSRTDQKCVAETEAILDAGFAQLAQDKETDTVIIPGDLVYRAEKASHLLFIEKLRKLEACGKKIFVITAAHDYDDNACGFVGNETVPVEGTTFEELRDLYYDFGTKQALSEHRPTHSYVAQLCDGVRLLALNCDGDKHHAKGVWTDDQKAWMRQQTEQAKKDGQYIFAINHYPLLPANAVFELVGDAKMQNWRENAAFLADLGVDLIFTGHMHNQSLTQFTSPEGHEITDICTGSFVGHPCAYRKVEMLAEPRKIHITSYTIHDFDWDKGGKTAEEYFIWRFDRMITDIIDAMAYDFAFFTRLFGGPEKNKKLKAPVTVAGKILQKLTLGGVGRLFCFKVDPSIRSRLLKDTGVELVRNIFTGNEPYVRGTPMYAAVSKLMDRLKPITRIIEKKAGASNPVLSDLKGLMLGLIGDEKQMDYEAVLDWKI